MALVRPTDLGGVIPALNAICDQLERWARGSEQIITDPKLRGELLAPSSVGTAALTAGGVTLGKLATSFADAPPGYVVASGSFNSPQTTTNNTEATAITLVTSGSFTANGSRAVLVTFFAPAWTNGAVGSNTARLSLFDGSSSFGIFGQTVFTAATQANGPVAAATTVVPGAGAHTFSVRLWTATGGTVTVNAGAGGASTLLPGVIQISVI